MHSIASLIAIAAWIAGIVIAKGFWSVFLACLFIPYSWYLVVEKIMIAYGLA